MKNKFLIFLKGILMGICDLVPGISGGTIAFITGIYERLINAVKAISPQLFYNFIAGGIFRKEENLIKLKTNLKKLDLIFLLVLLAGISSAFIIGSRVVKFLLDNYFIYTMAFFVGLILASSKIIFNKIQNHNFKTLLFGIFGFMFGILLAFVMPVTVVPNFSYVVFGGFLAINAMLLPGISGAFILLIMGLYEFMLEVLKDIPGHLNYFLGFILGVILGAFTISRIVSFLFRKYRCKTLYFLLGLVIGALSTPIKRIFINGSFTTLNIAGMLCFLILGIGVVSIVEKYS